MPKRRQSSTLPPDVKLIQFDPDKPKPLFVKATDIDRIIVGLSPKTMANWRSQGIGPRYHLVGGSVYYLLNELESFFGQNKVETRNCDYCEGNPA
jgi:hypothetical protein